MLIRSHSSFWRLADVDPDTGRVTLLPIWRGWTQRNQETKGWFAGFSEGLVAIYSHHGQLYVTCGAAHVLFKSIDVEYSSAGKKKRLRLRRSNELLFAAEYRVRIPQFANDPTPHVDPEHFDFGLFLHNLSEDAARIERLAAF